MVSWSKTRTSLLERLYDGSDSIVWSEFFERYRPYIYSVARQRGCPACDADEIVQEVMLAIFEHKAVFRHDPERGRFRDWLGGVARKKAAAWRRAPARRTSSLGGSTGAESEAAAETDAAWEAAFEQAMLAYLLELVRREISPKIYQAFEAVALGECSGAEVARLTGLTRNAVYQARKKVLRRLRELGARLEENGPPDESIREAIRFRNDLP